jgi:formyl-CoA transferase
MATEATRPLSGVRVLDLTNVLAGPYCCYQLALMGADVIKVERPGRGDLARQLGSDPARNLRDMGISFLAQNAGKKSITLNLKDVRGKDLLKRLVRKADVLVENYRPGVMARLGLGPDILRAENERLIYCAISGFGQDGPWKDTPAYDQIVQGVSGVMSITGDTDCAPLRVGYPLADTVGGMSAAFSIAAALNAEPRGTVIDISMTDAVISTMGWVVSNYMIGGQMPAPRGNENYTSAPSGTFQTADRPINIAANRDEQWENLANHLGRSDLLMHPDFATREDRKRNRAHLRDELEATLMTRSSGTWVRELAALGIPCGPVLTVPQILAEPQVRDRELTMHFPEEGGIDIVTSPAVMDGARPTPQTAPPELGQDSAVIFGELGLSSDDINGLAEEGVI